jgi:mRNA-degrading endonuclease RelE of RelBE toxin-antitoxin system
VILLKTAYSKKAAKFLESQNDKTFFRITSAIERLPNGDVIKMKGYTNPTYRLTVGSFRIIFTRDKDAVSVIKIDNRGQVYKQ